MRLWGRSLDPSFLGFRADVSGLGVRMRMQGRGSAFVVWQGLRLSGDVGRCLLDSFTKATRRISTPSLNDR